MSRLTSSCPESVCRTSSGDDRPTFWASMPCAQRVQQQACEAVGIRCERAARCSCLEPPAVAVQPAAVTAHLPADRGCRQPAACATSGPHLEPRGVPQRLKLDERLGDAVVQLDDAPRLLAGHERVVGRKAVHRRLDAVQQLARPHDVAGLKGVAGAQLQGRVQCLGSEGKGWVGVHIQRIPCVHDSRSAARCAAAAACACGPRRSPAPPRGRAHSAGR